MVNPVLQNLRRFQRIAIFIAPQYQDHCVFAGNTNGRGPRYMPLFDVGDITEMYAFVGFADDREASKVLRCSALVLAADFTRTVLFANLAGGQILAVGVDYARQLVEPYAKSLHLFGGQFDFYLLLR